MTTLYHDPNWPRALQWCSGDHLQDPIGRIAIVGAPVHRGSISPGRCDLAPGAIRAALNRFSTCDVETGRELREIAALDLGTLHFLSELTPEQALPHVRTAVSKALEDSDAVVVLGGDNSITRPACHGLGPLDRCAVLTLDAHFDLRDLKNGLTNGNPIRALLADGLPGNHVAQIGIQSFANSGAYLRAARQAGICIATADQVFTKGIEQVVSQALQWLGDRAESIYVDIDLDVLDRAFAPATPGSRPGGLAPWQLRQAARLCGRHPKVRAVDLVEVDPSQDIADATSLAAAAAMLSFCAGVHERLRL